jgi:hypothetical protein
MFLRTAPQLSVILCGKQTVLLFINMGCGGAASGRRGIAEKGGLKLPEVLDI